MDQISHQNADVFRALQRLLAQDEFQDARLEFLNANLAKFEDAEENKLEYTSIYEAYVQIMDQLIDSKLAESCGFSQPQIEGFYNDFAKQSTVYEEMDNETYQMLLEFTDF